jgi:uncharacterized protein with PIN domain
MKIEYHKCDRCSKIQEVVEGSSLHTIVFDNDDEFEVCEDCFSSMWYSMSTYHKEVDKLIENVVKEE